MTICTKPQSSEYDQGWDRIFGKRTTWKEIADAADRHNACVGFEPIDITISEEGWDLIFGKRTLCKMYYDAALSETAELHAGKFLKPPKENDDGK